MSTHTYPYDPRVSIIEAVDLITAAGRTPTGVTVNPEDTVTFTFDPDLTAGQAQALDDLIADLTAIAQLGLPLSLSEYRARKQDISDLRTWMALPEGTTKNNNAVPALEATIRILGTLVKLQLP